MAEIIYEDDDLCVVRKTDTEDSERLAESMKMLPVHRLDKQTSGLLLLAKTPNAVSLLSGGFDKLYYAVLEGIIPEKSGSLSDLLFHDRFKNKTYVVDKMRSGVKKAELEYEVLDEKDGVSLARIHLLTGRTHQIRAQFSSRSLPVCGDRRYGSKADCPLALCCVMLSFTRPSDRKRMAFTSSPDGGAWERFLPLGNIR